MFWILQACVLFTDVQFLECDAPSDCIDEFGIGNTCGDEGYCTPIEPIKRCESTQPEDFWDDPSAYKDAFIIGQMFDFKADESKLWSTGLAYKDIVETGVEGAWVDGKPLVQITCNYENNAGDTLTEKDAVETVTDFLVNTMGVEVIVGPAGSQDSLYATNLSNGKALFISPSATAESLKPFGTTFSDERPGLFWRTTGSDVLQSAKLEEYLQSQDIDDIAILYQASIYGRGIGTALRALREESTGSAPETDTFEIDTASSISGKINALLADESIQALVFVSDNIDDILEAIKTMQTNGYENIPLLLTDTAAKTEMTDAIKGYTGGNSDLEASIVEQTIGTKPAIPNSAQFDEFVSRLTNQHGTNAASSVFAAHSYDATWLGATALLYSYYNEEPHNVLGFARGLRKISDTSLSELDLSPTGWNQIKERLQNNQSVNIVGVSGSLDYNLETEELTTAVDMWKFSADMSSIVTDFTSTEESENIIEPNTLQVTLHHGFNGVDIVPTAPATDTTPVDGVLTIGLLDSTTSDVCNVKWTISTGSTERDVEFDDFRVLNSLTNSDINSWYGFVLTQDPTHDDNCAQLSEAGQTLLTNLMQDQPGFGYAPLTDEMSTSLQTEQSENWNNVKDKVITGIISLSMFSGDESRLYYPINQTFIYEIQNEQSTWDPENLEIPQASALSTTETVNLPGFYVSESFFRLDIPSE